MCKRDKIRPVECSACTLRSPSPYPSSCWQICKEPRRRRAVVFVVVLVLMLLDQVPVNVTPAESLSSTTSLICRPTGRMGTTVAPARNSVVGIQAHLVLGFEVLDDSAVGDVPAAIRVSPVVGTIRDIRGTVPTPSVSAGGEHDLVVERAAIRLRRRDESACHDGAAG